MVRACAVRQGHSIAERRRLCEDRLRSLNRLGKPVTESFYIEGRRLLDATMRLGGTVGLAAMRPASGAISAGLRLERAARGAAGRRLNDAALSALDAALVSPVAEEAVDRAMASGLARHVVDRLLADGIIEHTVGRLLDGPELERVVGTVLQSPAVDRLVGQTIESRLADQAVARLLDSEELWLLVGEIAESPAVTEAITQQGFGFADEVAGGMRARSRNADAWLERTARRALRRPQR